MVSHKKSSSSDSSGSPLPSRGISVEVDPKSREEANERERKRTKLLNDGFKKLRDNLPYRPADKMSKIKTLQIAAQYMIFLTKESDSANSWKTSSFSAESVAQLHAFFNAKREMEERASVCSPNLQCPNLPRFNPKFGGICGRRNQYSSSLVKKELLSSEHNVPTGQWYMSSSSNQHHNNSSSSFSDLRGISDSTFFL
uniref:BHLH domain-containing protein n=1 Tax=Ditylenchus dipsaci TaxID=166011 RepID=A0A915D7Z1_9BILA